MSTGLFNILHQLNGPDTTAVPAYEFSAAEARFRVLVTHWYFFLAQLPHTSAFARVVALFTSINIVTHESIISNDA